MMFSKAVILLVVGLSASLIAAQSESRSYSHTSTTYEQRARTYNPPNEKNNQDYVVPSNKNPRRDFKKPINQRQENYNQHSVEHLEDFNEPQRNYHQRNGYPSSTSRPEDFHPKPTRQPVNDHQQPINPSRANRQSANDGHNGRTDSSVPPKSRGTNKPPTDRQPEGDRPKTGETVPNPDHPKTPDCHDDQVIYSSVPLHKFYSNNGHEILAGTSRIPGGISSVVIDNSPNHQSTSSVVHYSNTNEENGAVTINSQYQSSFAQNGYPANSHQPSSYYANNAANGYQANWPSNWCPGFSNPNYQGIYLPFVPNYPNINNNMFNQWGNP